MVNETVDIITSIPLTLLQRLELLTKIGQALGIVAIAYIIFLIVRGIIQWKYSRRIKSMFKTVDGIDRKLDRLIKINTKKKKK
jgi:hypothetical protein